MIKIVTLEILLLLFWQCLNQPEHVENNSDQIKIDEYLTYINKPALNIHLKDKIINVDDSSNIGMEQVIVVGVHWPKKDSSMINDSGWTSCHASPTESCRNSFKFINKDTSGHFQYPKYLCIEYLYKNSTVFDTIFLDSIVLFCTNMFISPNYSNSRITDYSAFWRSEIINNSSVELKYMTIAMQSSVSSRGEYYYSFPNIGNDPFREGEPDPGGCYRRYSSFSPNDNYFNFSAGSGSPLVWIDIIVKSYLEYDIRTLVSVYFL
jgi:hypothetical protein